MSDMTTTDSTANQQRDEIALRACNISKRFGAVTALDDVSIELRYGRVTALLGDNGAGKSSLVKCISGVYQPDQGHIEVDGVEERPGSPDDARRLGVETVFQNLAIVEPLDVTENLFLNREMTVGGAFGRWLGILDKKSMRRDCMATLKRLDIRIPDPDRPIGGLSGGQRQAVAIGRAVAWGQKVVLLDEPTAALGVEQTARVLDLVRSLRDQGVAVMLITHNMENVIEVCDHAVVLRQGRNWTDAPVADIDADDLVAFITGARTYDR